MSQYIKKFIVHKQPECIICASCASLAPNNFEIFDDGSAVSRQPKTSEEERQCLEALVNCPMSIINVSE